MACGRCGTRWAATEAAPGCLPLNEVLWAARPAPVFDLRSMGRIFAGQQEMNAVEPLVRRAHAVVAGASPLLGELRDLIIEAYRLGRNSK